MSIKSRQGHAVMRKPTATFFIMTFITFVVLGSAISGEMELPPYKGSPTFESMKSLAGTWEGVDITDGKEKPAKVVYKVSSNGSTIIETLFPGEKYEMITVYHEKGGKLSMTHYCAIGNQPQMDLVKANTNVMEFTLAKSNDIDVAKDGHMHGLKITMVDKDHLIHNWTMYQKGKEGGVTTLKLARVQ